MEGVDPRRIGAQREREEQQRKILSAMQAEEITWLMADARGRRLMWRWLEYCGIFRTSFTGNSETFFREGERNVGLRMQAQILEHCPERWLEMMTESRGPAKV